jgi:hypothetical protein
MSLEAYLAVLEADLGDPELKNVLLGMANHAGPDGSRCYPSVRRIVAYTNLSEATVHDRLKKAQELGIIVLVKEANRQQPREYRIRLEPLLELRHPIIRELDGDGPRYGGSTRSAGRTPKIKKGSATRAEGSARQSLGVRASDSRGPPGGPEPKVLKPLTEPSEEPINLPRAADSPARRSKTESDRLAGGHQVLQILTGLGISEGQAFKFSPHFTPAEAMALADAARRAEPADLGAYAAQLFRDHLVEP